MTLSPRRLVPVVAVILLYVGSAVSAPDSKEPPSPAEDGTLKALTAIAGRGMMDSHAYDFLAELSDDIGGRVTGSPQAAQAITWGVARMKGIGLENVHTEKWQLSRGWTRVSADAEIISPAHHRLLVDSLGWVGSTPAGGVEADVVPVNLYRLKEETKDRASQWRGKVLLVVRKGEAPADRSSSFAGLWSLAAVRRLP